MRYFLLIPVLLLTACTVSNEQISTIREQCVADFGGKRLAPVEKCVYDRAIKEIDAVQNTNGYPYKAQFQQLMAERIQIATAYDKKKISKTDYDTANMMAESRFSQGQAAINQRNSDALGQMGQFWMTHQQNQNAINAANQPRVMMTTCNNQGHFVTCNSF
jgi:hypothetical protein